MDFHLYLERHTLGPSIRVWTGPDSDRVSFYIDEGGGSMYVNLTPEEAMSLGTNLQTAAEEFC